MERLTIAITAGAIVLLVGCSESPETATCTPGVSIACVGVGGCTGGQVCNADGTGYGACDCGSASLDAGNDDSDAGSDAGTDAGVEPCNLFEQTGCTSNERCSWVHADQWTSGARTCVPDGTRTLNESCSIDEVSRLDDCARGGVCVGGKCVPPCPLSVGSSCAGEDVCVRYAGFEENEQDIDLGFCEPTCNPVTQERADGAPACGSPDPANPTLGCYGMGPFTCSPVPQDAKDRRHGDAPMTGSFGTIFLNGCAPGHMPLLRASSTSSEVICIALCTPGETWQAQPANANGVSPYTCADRGATGSTVECRYWHFLEESTEPATPWGNAFGFCYDHANYSWNHDQDPGTPDVPTPSCTSLSNADDDSDGWAEHTTWACGPRP